MDVWHFDQRDTKQQRAILRTNRSAQVTRKRFAAGTKVRVRQQPANTGVVERHVPSTNAQGGSLTVHWDNGTTGRISPIVVEVVPEEDEYADTYSYASGRTVAVDKDHTVTAVALPTNGEGGYPCSRCDEQEAVAEVLVPGIEECAGYCAHCLGYALRAEQKTGDELGWPGLVSK